MFIPFGPTILPPSINLRENLVHAHKETSSVICMPACLCWVYPHSSSRMQLELESPDVFSTLVMDSASFLCAALPFLAAFCLHADHIIYLPLL